MTFSFETDPHELAGTATTTISKPVGGGSKKDGVKKAKSSGSGQAKHNKASIMTKPRRPLNAYNFFFRSERPKVFAAMFGPESDHAAACREKESKSIMFAKIGKVLSAKWANISKEDLARFRSLAAEDHNRYQLEKKKWMVQQQLEQEMMEQPRNQVTAEAKSDTPMLVDNPEQTNLSATTGRKKSPPKPVAYASHCTSHNHSFGSSKPFALEPSRKVDDNNKNFQSSSAYHELTFGNTCSKTVPYKTSVAAKEEQQSASPKLSESNYQAILASLQFVSQLQPDWKVQQQTATAPPAAVSNFDSQAETKQTMSLSPSTSGDRGCSSRRVVEHSPESRMEGGCKSQDTSSLLYNIVQCELMKEKCIQILSNSAASRSEAAEAFAAQAAPNNNQVKMQQQADNACSIWVQQQDSASCRNHNERMTFHHNNNGSKSKDLCEQLNDLLQEQIYDQLVYSSHSTSTQQQQSQQPTVTSPLTSTAAVASNHVPVSVLNPHLASLLSILQQGQQQQPPVATQQQQLSMQTPVCFEQDFWSQKHRRPCSPTFSRLLKAAVAESSLSSAQKPSHQHAAQQAPPSFRSPLTSYSFLVNSFSSPSGIHRNDHPVSSSSSSSPSNHSPLHHALPMAPDARQALSTIRPIGAGNYNHNTSQQQNVCHGDTAAGAPYISSFLARHYLQLSNSK